MNLVRDRKISYINNSKTNRSNLSIGYDETMNVLFSFDNSKSFYCLFVLKTTFQRGYEIGSNTISCIRFDNFSIIMVKIFIICLHIFFLYIYKIVYIFCT